MPTGENFHMVVKMDRAGAVTKEITNGGSYNIMLHIKTTGLEVQHYT